jgi:hypothetical protein
MMATRDTPSAQADWGNAVGARGRARKLHSDVERTSSEGARIFQTLNHLAGKKAGDAADAAIRHVENMKESEAEDLETRSKILDKSGDDKAKSHDHDPKKGRNMGDL